MAHSSLVATGVAFPVGAVVALAASYVLVTRLERLADRLGLSGVALGLLVALAADSPEIATAVSAAIHGARSTAAGVVLGSNVFNLAALLGLGAIVAGSIRLHRRVALLDGIPALWVALVSVLTVGAGLEPGWAMVLILAVVIPYLVVSLASTDVLRRLGLPSQMTARLSRAVVEQEDELADATIPIRPASRPTAPTQPVDRRRPEVLGTLAMVASLVVVVGASVVMERSASTIGDHFGLSSLVVGGIILAAVTSLPNALGAVYLAGRGRGSAVLSEAMSSNMVNVVVGLLVPGIILGIEGSSGDGLLVATWYLGLTAVSLALVFGGRGLTRRDGAVIVAGYLGFVAVAVLR